MECLSALGEVVVCGASLGAALLARRAAASAALPTSQVVDIHKIEDALDLRLSPIVPCEIR